MSATHQTLPVSEQDRVVITSRVLKTGEAISEQRGIVVEIVGDCFIVVFDDGTAMSVCIEK